MNNYSDLEIAILRTLKSAMTLFDRSSYRPEGLRNDVEKNYPSDNNDSNDNFEHIVRSLAVEGLIDAETQPDGSFKINGLAGYGYRVLRELDSHA